MAVPLESVAVPLLGHLPVMIEWKTAIRVSKKVKTVELNFKKGDWRKYKEVMESRMGLEKEEMGVRWKLIKLTSLMGETSRDMPGEGSQRWGTPLDYCRYNTASKIEKQSENGRNCAGSWRRRRWRRSE